MKKETKKILLGVATLAASYFVIGFVGAMLSKLNLFAFGFWVATVASITAFVITFFLPVLLVGKLAAKNFDGEWFLAVAIIFYLFFVPVGLTLGSRVQAAFF